MTATEMQEKSGHLRLFAWHIRDVPRRVEISLPCSDVLQHGVMSLPAGATPADLDRDAFIAPAPDLRVLARPGVEQLILMPLRRTGPVPLSEKLVHHGDGERFTRISGEGAVMPVSLADAARQFRTGILWAGPTPRTIWPAPVPPVAVVFDTDVESGEGGDAGVAQRADDQGGEDPEALAEHIISAPAVVVPSLRATVHPEMIKDTIVLRSRRLCRWLLARTRGDVFHPKHEPVARRVKSVGTAYVVFGGRARDWHALAMLCGGRP